MKQFLLSGLGERHEDRLPNAIFSSMEKVRNYLQDYAVAYFKSTLVVVDEQPYKGDYGDCIGFTLHHKNDTDCQDAIAFIADSFDVDPTFYSFQGW